MRSVVISSDLSVLADPIGRPRQVHTHPVLAQLHKAIALRGMPAAAGHPASRRARTWANPVHVLCRAGWPSISTRFGGAMVDALTSSLESRFHHQPHAAIVGVRLIELPLIAQVMDSWRGCRYAVSSVGRGVYNTGRVASGCSAGSALQLRSCP